ncbi:MAG: aldehyde ferredoxin oxidoreductase N-terminal domain-containing protein, partial [Desulfosalsimonas sp.]
MYGCYNTLLNIDATGQTHREEKISDQTLQSTLGGKGLAAKLLLERNPPRVDAFSPENNLIFAIGPATGTSIWGSCRYGVFTKSPQTGY